MNCCFVQIAKNENIAHKQNKLYQLYTFYNAQTKGSVYVKDKDIVTCKNIIFQLAGIFLDVM